MLPKENTVGTSKFSLKNRFLVITVRPLEKFLPNLEQVVTKLILIMWC